MSAITILRYGLAHSKCTDDHGCCMLYFSCTDEERLPASPHHTTFDPVPPANGLHACIKE